MTDREYRWVLAAFGVMFLGLMILMVLYGLIRMSCHA